jgi:hypothetical protein
MDENLSDTLRRFHLSTPGLTMAVVIVLVGAAGFLGLKVFTGSEGDTDTLRFIALLIIFMVAMATTAALFVILKMGNAGEAFGLPSGSIRALLAMGIMMLFVVFGLPVISSDGVEVVTDQFAVAQEQLSDTVRLNREQGFHVQIVRPGTAATGTPPAGGVPAIVRIVGRIPAQSAAQLDLTKQLLTAIITLLTTVIGFYFGSRSSTDAIREQADAADRAGGPDNGDGGGGGPPPLEAVRGQIETDFAPLKGQVERLVGEVDREVQELGALPQPMNAQNKPRRDALLMTLSNRRSEAQANIQEIGAELEAAAAERASRTEATEAAERARSEAAERGHLQKAADLVPLLRQGFALFQAVYDAAPPRAP